MEDRRWAIPVAKSWYVAFGWTAERKAFGSKDLELISTAAPIHRRSSKLCIVLVYVRCERTGFHVHVFHTADERGALSSFIILK
jgi:hypothetical protein